MSDEAITESYKQWASFLVVNSSREVVAIKDLKLMWGKFYEDGNKNKEIPRSSIDNIEIRPGYEFKFNTCGRKGATSGAKGSFDISSESGSRLVQCSYSCPWGSNKNSWAAVVFDSKWKVEDSGANLHDGALGNIRIELYSID